MRQRISVEQLQELTEEQKEKLREWWKPKAGDTVFIINQKVGCDNKAIITDWDNKKQFGICYFNCFDDFGLRYYDIDLYGKENLTPLLSIGQMIEFLDDHVDGFDLHKFDIYGFAEDYKLNLWGHIENTFDSYEPCDALWKAVKEIL